MLQMILNNKIDEENMDKGHFSKAPNNSKKSVSRTHTFLFALIAVVLLVDMIPAAQADSPIETADAPALEWMDLQPSQFSLDASIFQPGKANLPKVSDLIVSPEPSIETAYSETNVTGSNLYNTIASFATPQPDVSTLRIFVPFAEHNFLDHIETRTDVFAFGQDSRTGF